MRHPLFFPMARSNVRGQRGEPAIHAVPPFPRSVRKPAGPRAIGTLSERTALLWRYAKYVTEKLFTPVPDSLGH